MSDSLSTSPVTCELDKQLDLIPLGGSKTPPRGAQTVHRDYQCLLGQLHLIRKTAVSEFLMSVT